MININIALLCYHGGRSKLLSEKMVWRALIPFRESVSLLLLVVNCSKTCALTNFMGSGLLLNTLLEVENEFSASCTTVGFQCLYLYDRFGLSQ